MLLLRVSADGILIQLIPSLVQLAAVLIAVLGYIVLKLLLLFVDVFFMDKILQEVDFHDSLFVSVLMRDHWQD